MRKGIVGIFALFAVFLFSHPGWTGVLSELKDDIDDQCVINCLRDDGQSSGECKRADVIACQDSCHLPPPAALYIGGVAVNPDLEDPGKIAGIFQAAFQSLHLVEGKDAKAYITFPNNNPLADLGLNPSIIGILTMLAPNLNPSDVPGLGNIVVAQGELPCMASKNYTYPSGMKGLGCRETKKFGANGWAAQGCGTEAAASAGGATEWFGDWSTFCCSALGRPCPTCALQPGYGVCSVNSTAGGDGVY